MQPCPFPLEGLLPHRPPMILIDSVTSYDANSLTSSVHIRSDFAFFQPNKGVPAHVAIEWMAQTCGAYAGLQDRMRGTAVKLGLLLGTRAFSATIAWFKPEDTLSVTAQLSYLDNTIGVFDCSVRHASTGVVCATAQLTVFQPSNTEAFIAGSGLRTKTP